MPFPRRSLVLAATAVAVVACGNDPTEPAAGAPARVIIEGNPGLLEVGDTVRLGARAYDAAGRLVLPGARASWRALDTGLVRVDSAGLVTGWEGGVARVVATSGAVADTATLLIEVRVDSVAFDVVNVSYTPDGRIHVGNTLSLRPSAYDGRRRLLATPPITLRVADTTIASAPVYPGSSIWGSSSARRAGTTTFTAEVAGVRAERSIEVFATAAALAGGAR